MFLAITAALNMVEERPQNTDNATCSSSGDRPCGPLRRRRPRAGRGRADRLRGPQEAERGQLKGQGRLRRGQRGKKPVGVPQAAGQPGGGRGH